MDSKLDSNKDEKSNVTENDASKVETSRIKLFVGLIAGGRHYYSDRFCTC